MDKSLSVYGAAIVEGNVTVGQNTAIGSFTHILRGAQIGADCKIGEYVYIESLVKLGDRVTVKPGVQLWNGLHIEDDVLIGQNATFASDPLIRRGTPEEFAPVTLIRQGASIGANATIMLGVTIGRNAVIGPGAVVTKDVPPNAIVNGNPALIQGYVSTHEIVHPHPRSIGGLPQATLFAGVTVVHLPQFEDMRGSLSVGEVDKHLPFVPRRYFLVFNVPSKEVRGEHAHRSLHQFLVCVHGSCAVVVDDGNQCEEIILDHPTVGLHISPMVWASQYKFTSDAVLLVLASAEYNAADYIRDYDEFLALAHRT